MANVTLLPGERIEARLRPHPASFASRYLVAALPALWGIAFAWLVRSPLWAKVPWDLAQIVPLPVDPQAALGYVILAGGLLALGSWVAVARIGWSVWFLYAAALAVAITVAWQRGHDFATAAPAVLVLAGACGAAWSEANRRRHAYVLTNVRILFEGGLLTSKQRQVRLESLTDLDATQGPLGRLLGYGTIVPISQSGFGLGADSAQASIAAGRARGGFGMGASAGGGRSVQTGRARSFHSLAGVHPFAEVKSQLERLLHEASSGSLLQRQVDLQERTVAALERPAEAAAPLGSVPGSSGLQPSAPATLIRPPPG